MKKSFSVIFALVVGCILSNAQTLNSGYFLDNYNYGHTISPAIQPNNELQSYFGLILNNTVTQGQSNVGASAFLYPVGDKLVSGLNEQVPANVFLANLKDINLVRANINQNMFNFGVHTGERGFFHLDVGLKSTTDTDVPKSFFQMLKVGVKKDEAYNITDVNLWTSNYLEIAAGYSHRIGDKLTIGARAKVLVGIGLIEMNIDKLSVITNKGDGKVYTSGQGTMGIACNMLKMGTVDGRYDLSTLAFGSTNFSGFGLGFDLGVSYKPIEDLTIDLAVQDIGKIKWNRNINGKMDYTDRELALGGKLDLESLLEFKPVETDNFSNNLPATVRIGAKYVMPFYRNLSARALATIVTGQHNKYTDIRIGATVTPIKQISATANYGWTTYGSTFGAALNFNLGIINLFLGADSLLNTMTPQFLPVNAFSMTYSFGLNFQIKRK